ncbi:MAG TPA: hypothetical protein VLS51_00750 [Propionibacteriaceae bacterium]|nr:hypothetical protein [Propionibacteriaceae bacterium]
MGLFDKPTKHVQHQVNTTKDRIVLFGCTIGVSGSATALSCSIEASTDDLIQVSGTSPGLVTVVTPQDLAFPQIIAWGADLHAGSTSSLNFGGPNGLPTKVQQLYHLQKNAYAYPYGAQRVSSSVGLFANPYPQGAASTMFDVAPADTSGFGAGGSVFSMQIYNLQAQVTGNVQAGNVTQMSASAADPVDASVANGSPTAKITIWALYRARGRYLGW